VKKCKYLVDGRFLASMSTGVDRYAYQILRELDKICTADVSVLVPGNAKEVPKYRNIKVIQSGKSRFWTQGVFGSYALFHGMTPVNLCNEAAWLAPKGIVCLHDVCYAESSEVFPYVYDYPADEREWFLKIYKRILKKAKKLITVSEFSKCRIMECLGADAEKITVIGNGWQHFKNVGEDASIFAQYPNLKNKEYYFTLTSANKNKNLDWILKNSKVNPDEQYVVAGKNLDRIADFNRYPNITYVGFASDEMAKTLMSHCKAFIFPSYYEGFGIPPLEALSTGAEIVVSNTASLPEIFGDSAHYIDPDNPVVHLDELLNSSVTGAEKVLEKYSWESAAKKLNALFDKEI
jgi:glycosyltransferase involved in cell wall biosynthesis